MELEYRKLSEPEIAAGLLEIEGWDLGGGEIFKLFGFENYLDGVAFAAAVGYVAEKLDHHPDILIGWRKVRVAVNTHSVEGISPYDFELAKRIEALGR